MTLCIMSPTNVAHTMKSSLKRAKRGGSSHAPACSSDQNVVGERLHRSGAARHRHKQLSEMSGKELREIQCVIMRQEIK